MKNFILATCAFLFLTTNLVANGWIQGTLCWFNKPKDGAIISIYNENFQYQIYTNNRGSYAVSVPPGLYLVTAPGPWANKPFETKIALVLNNRVTVINFFFF